MKKFIVYIIGIILVILENSVLNSIEIFGTTASLTIPFLVIVSLEMDEFDAGIAGLIVGLLKDMTVGGIFGMNAVILSSICYFIGHFRRNFYRNNENMIMGLIAIVSAVSSIVYFIVSAFLYHTDGILICLLRAVVIIPVLNIVIGFIIYRLFGRIISKLMEE